MSKKKNENLMCEIGRGGREKSGACSRSRAAAGSPSDTDILHDHCHIDNTPAPEAIDTWVDKCKKLERERNALNSALHRLDRIYRQDLDDPGNRPDWLQIHFENVKHDHPACGVEFFRMLSENRAANMG